LGTRAKALSPSEKKNSNKGLDKPKIICYNNLSKTKEELQNDYLLPDPTLQ
jgi:hypothetical protein